MHINYDNMLADYKKNMETNLRGFSGGPPPFECWVPYEGDDKRSIDDIISIARESGNEVVSVKYGDQEHSFISKRALTAEVNLTLLSGVQVKVVGLKKNVLTIDYPISETKFHENLIKLEASLNKQLNEKFDIQTLNIDDKNKRKAACAK